MLGLKDGVKLTGLQPPALIALLAAERAFTGCGFDCIVTSANDSTHSQNSLHYRGLALDFRTKFSGCPVEVIAAALRAALGRDFDVVLEDRGSSNEHLHVEYDPKGG